MKYWPGLWRFCVRSGEAGSYLPFLCSQIGTHGFDFAFQGLVLPRLMLSRSANWRWLRLGSVVTMLRMRSCACSWVVIFYTFII